MGCAAGAYCDTVPATPVCSTTQKTTGTTCVNNYECKNGTCAEVVVGTPPTVCN
jgi:hypothetical protein